MLELLQANPWLIVVILGMMIPILGIIFGTITNYLAHVRLAEMEATLKQDMLQRGMSAEEIRTVVEASSRRKGKKCGPESYARHDVP
jgi:hypothetical protein